MTPEQCRAARAWLGITQEDLARRSGVGLSSVKDFEGGKRATIPSVRGFIRKALEKAGARFLDEEILRVLPPAQRPHEFQSDLGSEFCSVCSRSIIGHQ